MERQRRQRRRQVTGRCGCVAADTLTEPRDRLRQPVVGNRLQQVVDGGALEGLYGVLVVGGDEHDVHVRVRRARNVEPGQSGHPDIEERDVRRFAQQQRLRFRPVGGRAGDHELRPQHGEPGLQELGQSRLVVGDDRRDRAVVAHGSGMTRVTRDPIGPLSSIVSRAAFP
jgi:hypothetical protein